MKCLRSIKKLQKTLVKRAISEGKKAEKKEYNNNDIKWTDNIFRRYENKMSLNMATTIAAMTMMMMTLKSC